MPIKLVTCPETAHLEQIDYDAHPLGALVRSCTRFRPATDVTCHGRCARWIDRRHATTQDLDDEATQTDGCGPLCSPPADPDPGEDP